MERARWTRYWKTSCHSRARQGFGGGKVHDRHCISIDCNYVPNWSTGSTRGGPERSSEDGRTLTLFGIATPVERVRFQKRSSRLCKDLWPTDRSGYERSKIITR